MKFKRYLWVIILPIFIIFTIILPAKTQENLSLNALFQASTITALSKGVFEGNTTFKELRQHGNFGLGTVDFLDGEMIGIDGKFYEVKYNGVASVIPDSTKTPFATVTFFKADKSINLENKLTYQQLQEYIDKEITTTNYPYAIRIKGKFPYLKFRTVPKQTLPYVNLAEVIKKQAIFELKNISGTLVGFRTPAYMQGVNVNGYHLHFLSADRKTGGHLLDGEFQNIKVEIDALSHVEVSLPQTDAFAQAGLASK